MKKFNKYINLILVVFLSVAHLAIVDAAGSATLNLNASNATTGANVDFTVSLSNIVATGGFAGFEAKVDYDSDYLEYVSKTSMASFNVGYTNSIKTISGAAFDEDSRMKGSSANVIKLTFRAKKAGSTTVTIKDAEISAGNNDILSTSNASKTITISDPVPKSTNAFLSALGVTGYNLTPAFNKNTLEYKVSVPYSVTSATITATPEDSKANVQRSLNVSNLKENQDNRYTITCTAEDGTTKKSYVVIIHRQKAPDVPKSTDNTLKSLAVSGFPISPAFNKDTLKYSISVPNESDKIIVNATANDGKAKVEVKGADNLKVGNNLVEVVVTAEDGSTKVYTIDVVRAEKVNQEQPKLDDDATLSKLYIGGYTLNPTFNKNTNVYTINVGSQVGGLNVEAIPTSSKAKVQVVGNNSWKYGMNTVTITVTAENGNKNVYIVNVNRKDPTGQAVTKSGDSYLNSLVINGFTISPRFDKDVSSYAVTVPYDTEKLDISYVASDKKAKVEIIGNDELEVGANNVQIKVTAEDGSVRIYTINTTRAAFSAKNDLKILSANGFTLNPGFDKDKLEYTMTVKSNTDSLDLTAIAEDENAKVEITGNSNFKTGNNVILIKVTDQNGFTKYYRIDVEKPESSIFGMSLGQFLMYLLLGLGLLGILLLLIILLKRKNNKDEKKQVTTTTPVIDFKPEFNFGSRNGTDDDVVYPGGVFNQGNSIPYQETKKLMEANYRDLSDADYEEITENFDYFDQTITKDELIAAIREGIKTNNTDKLEMLLKQDELNQLKKEIKKKEMAKKKSRSDKYGNY